MLTKGTQVQVPLDHTKEEFDQVSLRLNFKWSLRSTYSPDNKHACTLFLNLLIEEPITSLIADTLLITSLSLYNTFIIEPLGSCNIK